jgi:hypothetical protein
LKGRRRHRERKKEERREGEHQVVAGTEVVYAFLWIFERSLIDFTLKPAFIPGVIRSIITVSERQQLGENQAGSEERKRKDERHHLNLKLAVSIAFLPFPFPPFLFLGPLVSTTTAPL